MTNTAAHQKEVKMFKLCFWGALRFAHLSIQLMIIALNGYLNSAISAVLVYG